MRVLVDAGQFEIRTGEITREKLATASLNTRMLDGLAGRGHDTTYQVEVCYLLAVVDNVRVVSPPIPREKIALQFLLEQQKQIAIYFERENKERYFFDLDFLNPA